MSSKSYRSSNKKKMTRTLSKIQQTILEEERREKLRKSTSLFQKKQNQPKRKYKKQNNQVSIIYKNQSLNIKREKRETQQSNNQECNFKINPKYMKMSWVEIDEIPEKDFQDFWVIDSEDEE